MPSLSTDSTGNTDFPGLFVRPMKVTERSGGTVLRSLWPQNEDDGASPKENQDT